MKRNIFYSAILIAAAFILNLQANAQVAINANGANPDGSAMLDITSTSKGILIPRMSAAQRDAISLPIPGLLVYCSDDDSFYYSDGSVWIKIGGGLTSIAVTFPIIDAGTPTSPNIGLGTVPLGNGGTGAIDAPGARDALGLGTLAKQNSINNADWSGTKLTVPNGGTGAATFTTGQILIGNGSSAVSTDAKLYWTAGTSLLTVNGKIKQTQLPGSLTDNTPTAAQITAIAGTPASTGAGFKIVIKDTDGSGLLYQVESDGTSWFYTVMTKAL